MTRLQNDNCQLKPHIGGLLLFVGLNIFMDLFSDISVLFSVDWSTFSAIKFKTLTTPIEKSLLYDTRLWALELITGCISAYLFLKKKKLFVNWFILLIILGIICEIFDINTYKDTTDIFLERGAKFYKFRNHYYLPIIIFLNFLCILYFIFSKRVKCTFIQ